MARPVRNGLTPVDDPEAISTDDKMASTENSDRRLTRKLNKPLMERRRRERINVCLDQLKTILMDVTKKESSFYSKLEKADILELTVKYMHSIRRHNNSKCAKKTSTSADERRSRYISGFNECIREVTTYLSSAEGLDEDTRIDILNYLSNTILMTDQTPTAGPLNVHDYDPAPPSGFPSQLPHIQFYQDAESCSMTSHTESNCQQEASCGRPQATSSSEDRASFTENTSNVRAETKSWTEEASFPPIRNFYLHEQNSFNGGKKVAQTNIPMKVVPAWLASGKRILLLTGSQSAAILPVMPCTGSWLVHSEIALKSNTDIESRESFLKDPSAIFASSDSCAILGNEPKTDFTQPEADTTCDIITSEDPPKFGLTGSASKSGRCRVTCSDDVIASPRKDAESYAEEGSDFGKQRNEPKFVKLATSSDDMWRPW